MKVAKLYTSAFLDATIRGDTRYIALFRDYHLIESWLPKSEYISRYQDSSFQTVATFDEDIDPETTTVRGGTIIGINLERWHEEDISTIIIFCRSGHAATEWYWSVGRLTKERHLCSGSGCQEEKQGP